MDDESKCIVCGSQNRKLIYQIMDYKIVGCDCGLMYVHPLPSQDDLREIYSESYFLGNKARIDAESAMDVGGYVHQEETSKESFLDRLRIIEGYRKNGRLLDIGCAVGHFLKAARSQGWDTHGVEISEFASEYARKNYSLNIITGELSDGNFEDDYFDVVTMWDVIEHLQNPKKDLIEVNRILKSEGILLLTTANMLSFDAKFLREGWGTIISPPGHVYYFTVKSFLRLLKETGFEPIDIITIGFFADIPILRDIAYGIRKRFPGFRQRIDRTAYGNTIFAVMEKGGS
jgi:2-polyprenyl-3-methyl-5-hydroxy-6-metoxy-1,4-benzoquinol methylase